MQETNIAEKARLYAIDRHNKKNNTYDGQPYSVHLDIVNGFIEEFIHLIPEEDRDNVRGGGWTHDTVEDCGETFNDVKEATNEEVAECAYALTNEKGKTREERANSKYYRGIRKHYYFKFLKLADRLANVLYSYRKGSGMFKKYQKENPKFVWKLIKPEWYEIHEWFYRLMIGKENYLYQRILNDKCSEMIVKLLNFFNNGSNK